MSEIAIRDISRAGHPLGTAVVRDLPPEMTPRELIRARVTAEVAAYNRDPGQVFVGLVQPEDAIRHSDGHRMAAPRPLDADGMVSAALEAAASGLLRFQAGERTITDLDEAIHLDDHDELVTILERPIVARVS